MALDGKKLERIRADVEAGIVTKSDICKKHKISRMTLSRLEKKHKWEYAKSYTNVTRNISKKATERIVENESLKLIDFTTRHLGELETIRILTRLNSQSLAKAFKETKNNISKEEADRIFTIQKVCKISTETLALIYRDERLAMGLDGGGKSADDEVEGRINKRMNKLKNAD